MIRKGSIRLPQSARLGTPGCSRWRLGNVLVNGGPAMLSM